MRVSQTRGPGHSWLPRRRPRRSRKRMRGRRLGSPGSSSSRRFARNGRSRKRTGGRSTLYISPGRGGCTSPTRMRPMRTGRLGAQWAAAGRTAGASSFGCLLRPSARLSVVAAFRRAWKVAVRLWRVRRSRPLTPRGPPPRLTGHRRPPSQGVRRQSREARQPRKGVQLNGQVESRVALCKPA